jgi:hypothetical protein
LSTDASFQVLQKSLEINVLSKIDSLMSDTSNLSQICQESQNEFKNITDRLTVNTKLAMEKFAFLRYFKGNLTHLISNSIIEILKSVDNSSSEIKNSLMAHAKEQSDNQTSLITSLSNQMNERMTNIENILSDFISATNITNVARIKADHADGQADGQTDGQIYWKMIFSITIAVSGFVNILISLCYVLA